MEQFRNFGIIKSQTYLSTFTWNKKEFNSYMIELKDVNGIFKINRSTEHEQALIGAQIMFNLSDDLSSVKRYKLVGYETVETKDQLVKRLIKERRERELRRDA
jgi:hypothetical protein